MTEHELILIEVLHSAVSTIIFLLWLIGELLMQYLLTVVIM